MTADYELPILKSKKQSPSCSPTRSHTKLTLDIRKTYRSPQALGGNIHIIRLDHQWLSTPDPRTPFIFNSARTDFPLPLRINSPSSKVPAQHAHSPPHPSQSGSPTTYTSDHSKAHKPPIRHPRVRLYRIVFSDKFQLLIETLD
jgi:hypothetical protein